MNCSVKDEASEAGSETGSESILPDAGTSLREEQEIEKVSDFLRFHWMYIRRAFQVGMGVKTVDKISNS